MNLTLDNLLIASNGVHILIFRIILYAAHTIWKKVKRISHSHQPVSIPKDPLDQFSQIALNQQSSFDFKPFLFLRLGRIGRIYLFKYDMYLDDLERLDVIETAAILDANWLVVGNRCLLIAASALSEILVYELKTDDRLHLIDRINLAGPDDENLLTLAIDVRATPVSENLIASDSRGMVSLLTVTQTNIVKQRTWKAHSFEAWTCAFDKWNPNVVYTGGDDTFMHVYDIRAADVQQTIKNKCHIAGVTSFLSFTENCLITGSYDEYLRIFDTRAWRAPVYELQLFGGIWRIKPSKCDRNRLLCACMYKNFSLCRINNERSELKLEAEFTKHESICYGADWAPNRLCNGGQVMATCSFYDKKLCISSVHE